MTDNEIIKALECCLNNNNCSKCPLKNVDCRKKLIDDALNLINRKNEEIERLKKRHNDYIDKLKEKALLNNPYGGSVDCFEIGFIDKEMVGEQE